MAAEDDNEQNKGYLRLRGSAVLASFAPVKKISASLPDPTSFLYWDSLCFTLLHCNGCRGQSFPAQSL